MSRPWSSASCSSAGKATGTRNERLPLRLLLLSDTHGRLDVIHELVEATRADAVVHAGDFGLYDGDSVARLSRRELNLRVVHSGLPDEEKRRVRALS